MAVPINPADPTAPVPPAFDADKQTAVTLFQINPGFATSDDAFGLVLETSWRPPGRTRNQSTNPQTGLHNDPHVRFSDDSSPVDMGDATVNIENGRFWKRRGWIDDRWSAFRPPTSTPPST